MNDYQSVIHQLYAQILAFVRDRPAIEQERLEREREFLRLSFFDCEPRKLFFDWFLFDYPLKKYRRRLFDVFLQDRRPDIPAPLYAIYTRLGKDRFSLFKVLAVKIGKQLLCQDVFSNRDYQVLDSSFTRHAAKGDYFFGRVLPFADDFVFAAACLAFQRQPYDLMGLAMKNVTRTGTERLDAFDVYKSLYPEPVPEQLSVEDKFALLCKEGGLSDDDIEDILLATRMAIKDPQTSAQQVLAGLLGKIRHPPEWFSLEEFSAAFLAVWNHLVGQIHPGVEKGPLELALLDVMMDALKRNFSTPPGMSDQEVEALSGRIQQWIDEWFVTPRAELEGQTPKQVILQERQARGNPQVDFGFQFKIEPSAVLAHQARQTDQLFEEAARQMAQGEYQRALDLYGDYLKIGDENHVVWHNMGLCYVMLLQKRKAERCLKKAVTLKPDYALAQDKLDRLSSMHRADMVQLVRELRKDRSRHK